MDQLFSLFLDGLHHSRMAVAQAVDGNAADHVDVFFSGVVCQDHTLALFDDDRCLTVSAHDVFFAFGDHFIVHLVCLLRPWCQHHRR